MLQDLDVIAIGSVRLQFFFKDALALRTARTSTGGAAPS
jgi:hypothetical protein